MKIIDILGSVPTHNNGLVEYAGRVGEEGQFNTGANQKYIIRTDIRHLFQVSLIAYGYSATKQVERVFIPDYVVKKVNGKYEIEIRLLGGCTCVYRIAGSVNTNIDPSPEIEKIVGEDYVDLHKYGHRHDGLDSKKISFTNLENKPYGIKEFVFYKEGTSYEHLSPVKERGYYVPYELVIDTIYVNTGTVNEGFGISPITIPAGSLLTMVFTEDVPDEGGPVTPGGPTVQDILYLAQNNVNKVYTFSSGYHPTAQYNVYTIVGKYELPTN